MENKIRYLSVCSGMEAATVAWHHMGWTPVGFSEIEPFPSQILKHHYPTIPNYGDLTKFKEWPLQRGSIDLLVGGTPCQAFSVAGLRQGLDDPRGNLALTFLALADHLRPKYILWENVPGVLSSNKGRDFASFIGALAQFGYGFAWRVCDAQYFGVPQRRKRVFLLAIEGAGNWKTAAEILFERKSLSGHFEESNKKKQSVTSDAGASVETGGILWSASDQPNAERLIDKAGTLNCNKGQRGGYICPTVLDRASFNQGQNAQYEPLIEQTETCPTLVSRGSHAVQMPIPIQDGREIEKKQNGMGVANEGDPAYTIDTTGSQSVGVVYENSRRDGIRIYEGTCPTLQSFMGTGGNNVPMVGEQKAYSIREDAKANNFSATPLEVTPALQAVRPSVQSHHAQTFVAQSVQGVDLYNQTITGDLHCPLRTAGGHGAPAVMPFDAYNQSVSNTSQTLSCSASDVNHTGAVFSPTMAVRRLTPVECERLQGFPDNYSQIPWKGKPASECPDGPRYKACGNSMAVPVMRFIGERIQKQIDGTL